MVACLIHGIEQTVREFGATTKELLGLADWLQSEGCQMTAMESTASYWKPLYNILESTGVDAMVVNPRHMKAVPGGKTDVKDAEWIADRLQHGLLRASYIPDKEQRELRELVGYRKSLVADRTRELNRLQKMLEGANIKLSGSVAEINGMSSRNILEVILSGEKIDVTRLEQMKKDKVIAHNLRTPFEQLAEDLNGFITPVQRRMMKELLSHLDELNVHIRNLDDDIDSNMKEEEKRAVDTITSNTGIAGDSARMVIAVIGTDMGRFPTDGHISSWTGLCPGNNESAKKRHSGKTQKGKQLLRSTQVVYTHSAVKVKGSYFYAQFQRVSAHRAKKRAYVAVAHSMLIAVYYVLKDGVGFKDLGAKYYNQFNRERKINAYLKNSKH